MFFRDRAIDNLDSDRGFSLDINEFTSKSVRNDCEKIKVLFEKRNIYLTMTECKVVYETYEFGNYPTLTRIIDKKTETQTFKVLNQVLKDVISDRSERIDEVFRQLDNSNEDDEEY